MISFDLRYVSFIFCWFKNNKKANSIFISVILFDFLCLLLFWWEVSAFHAVCSHEISFLFHFINLIFVPLLVFFLQLFIFFLLRSCQSIPFLSNFFSYFCKIVLLTRFQVICINKSWWLWLIKYSKSWESITCNTYWRVKSPEKPFWITKHKLTLFDIEVTSMEYSYLLANSIQHIV